MKSLKLAELAAVLNRIEDGNGGIDRFLSEFKSLRDMGGKVFFIGNGGSAAIASHMAADWSNRAKVSAFALNDAAALTATANDYSYEEVFRRQVLRHIDAFDMLVAISSSGKSENILKAAEAANDIGAVITLSGFAPDNPLRKLGNVNFYVPSSDYGIVETAHLAILHALLDKVAA